MQQSIKYFTHCTLMFILYMYHDIEKINYETQAPEVYIFLLIKIYSLYLLIHMVHIAAILV